MNIFLILTTCLCIAISCKQKNVRTSEILEVGVIKDVQAFDAKFDAEEIKLGVVKICIYNSRVRCFSGSLISHEGHIVTVGHEFHEILGGSMYKGSGHPRQKFVSDSFKVIPGFNGSETMPIVSPEFEFDVLAFHRTGASLDFALLKIKENQLREFNEWTFPLEIDLSYGSKNVDRERVFLAGYTWPHLSLADLNAASMNPFDSTIEKDRQKRHPSNFGFSLTTGIIENYDANPAKLLASRALDFESPDNQSISASEGASGGPLLNKDGIIIGIQSKASFKSVSKGNNENSKSYGNLFTRLDKIDKIFALHKIPTIQEPGKSISEARSKALEKVNILEAKKSEKLQKMVNQVIEKMGSRLSFNLDIPEDYETWCRIIGYQHQSHSTLWVHKIEIEILSNKKSRLRYFSKERKPPKKFWEFWKTGTWSPWFDFHTARLVTDYRIKPQADTRVPVTGGQGVFPYLIHPEKFRFFKIHPDAGGGYFDYHAQLLESIIGGRIPSISQSGKPKDYWTVSICE